MNRVDLTDWVIHFVHNRIPEDNIDDIITEIREVYDVSIEGIPSFYDNTGTPHRIFDSRIDEEYPIESDAPAFDVLRKIIHDGYIKSGWSFRNGLATIYGPSSAVCFTEMPLGSLISYAASRGKYVGTYGIAIKRKELFAVGGRQVIYGLSTTHCEAAEGDINFGKGLRCLASSTGIGLKEQYRYVATNLIRQSAIIDWTHEREWRWPLIDDKYGVEGLPILLDEDYIIRFSDIIIIVSTLKEKESILNLLKSMYDAGGSNIGYGYNIELIKTAKVLSIEELQQYKGDIAKIKLENISTKYFARIEEIKVSEEIKKKVAKIWNEAKEIAYNAEDEHLSSVFKGNDIGSAGYSYVTTTATTEITQALLELGIAESFANEEYILFGLPQCKVQSVDVHEAGAKAAAQYLTDKLGQKFSIKSILD